MREKRKGVQRIVRKEIVLIPDGHTVVECPWFTKDTFPIGSQERARFEVMSYYHKTLVFDGVNLINPFGDANMRITAKDPKVARKAAKALRKIWLTEINRDHDIVPKAKRKPSPVTGFKTMFIVNQPDREPITERKGWQSQRLIDKKRQKNEKTK